MELVVGMKIASERTRPVASRRKNHGRDRKRRGGPRRCIVFAPGRRSLDAYERRALSDRSPSRHAAAHRSPSNFHKILFTLCSFYISSTFSFSLSLSLTLSLSLIPYHRILKPYNVRPDRVRISRVRDRIVLLRYLRKSALLRIALRSADLRTYA